METKRQIIGRSNLRALVFVLFITFCSSVLVANEKVTSKPARYRVFSFRNISADTAKQYMTDAGIGTVSKIPGSETLLVTAQTAELIKASAILKLIDSKEQYVFETLAVGEEITSIPENDIIAEKVGNISIGTFANPPVIGAGDIAIIDIHNDSLVIVATSKVAEKVKKHIKAPEAVSEVEIVSEIVQDEKKSESVSDELFDNLMSSLAEADEKAKELGLADEKDHATSAVELKTKAQEGFVKLETVQEDLEAMGQLLPKTNQQPKAETEQTSEVVDSGILKTVQQLFKKDEDKVKSDEPVKQPKVDKAVSPVAVGKKPIAIEEKVEPKTNLDRENKVTQAKPEAKKIELAVDNADNPYEPDSSELADEELDLALPEELEIIDLLDFAGKYLGLDYMYDPELVKGKVALRIQRKIKVRELYPLIEKALKYKGFVMTRRGKLVTIVPADRMLDIDPEIHTEAKKVQYGDAVITRVFKLENIDTTSAKNLLDNLKLGANITDIPASGTLIVTGFAYRMAKIEELLEMADKPGKAKMFKFKKLKYTMATTLAPQVKELAEQLGAVSVTISQQTAAAAEPSRSRTPRRPTTRPKTPTRTTTSTSEPTAVKPEVFLDADERTNRILMIGLRDQLEEVEKLIAALDVEQQDLRIMRVYDIENVGAEDVSEKLAELGITTTARQSTYSASRSRSRSTSRSRITPTSKTAATTQASVTGADESPEEEPQVIIIESTNSLLVNATPDQHNKIASIIAYVDSEMREQEIPYVIYSLENQDPEDLAESLQKLIEKTTKDKEGKVQQTVKTTEDDIVIVPDKNTFSLIVYANKRNQLWISNLIQKLDRRRPQVLINVSLVEITKTDLFQYDLDVVTNMQDVITGNITKIAPIDSSVTHAWQAGWGGGTATGFYSNDRIQALLKAMKTKSYGRVLAQPNVLVNDNEEGKILTTEKTYVAEETQSYPGDGTNSVTTVEYKPYEAKIELSITPNISEGDLLRLEVSMIREDFERKEEGPPDYRTSNVETTVTVPDGSTIILGGLNKFNQTKSGGKVPLVGDIPLVGGLFRSVDNSDNASKLYIFVKANILRPEDAKGVSQLLDISNKKKEAFERDEKAFQEHEAFPGIKPETVDPLRVLESE